MSQSEVIAWLQAHPGWHRSVDIARDMGKQHRRVQECLRLLTKHGEIQQRKAKGTALEWSAANAR